MTIKKIPYTYGEYNFYETINNTEVRIASLTGQLVGASKMFLTMYFPEKEYSEVILDLKYHNYEEVLEKAKRIIRKKMYVAAQNILVGIR